MKIASASCAILLTGAVVLQACTKPAPNTTANHSGSQPPAPTHDHSHAEGSHGPSMALGTATIGAFSVRAARDEAHLHAGDEAAIDVWVDGDYQSIVAVRFWIGVESAEGSMKAKADIEDPNTPNHWHTHAVIPSPMPDGSKLWVEIETADGKATGSFDPQLDHSH